MAIYFTTNDPQKLLAAFMKKIDEKAIVTWSYDSDGDFTHTTPQWEKSAWLRPRVRDGKLALYIVCPKGKNITTTIYAIYHGRFIEAMLAHCDALFVQGQATAGIEGEDKVSAG
jgi:hypothetical protein